MRTGDLLSSLAEDVGQAVELGRVGDGGQQDQVITSGILVPTDEILDGPAAAKVAGGDVAEGEVALAPQLRAARPLQVPPGRPRPGRGPGERPGRAAAVDVAVGAAGHARE